MAGIHTTVILGAGSHLGRACAVAFAARGDVVALVERDADTGDRTLAAVAEAGGIGWRSNSSCPDDVVRECRDRGACVTSLVAADILLENIGLTDASAADWHRSMDVNLVTPALYGAAFLPLLREAGHAAIVLLGSIDGKLGNPLIAPYSVARGGVNVLTHLLAYEGAPHVRANCVAIAGVQPPSIGIVAPDDQVIDELKFFTPAGRLCDAAEVAAVATFVCSAAASYLNGAIIPVDGGRTAVTPGPWARRTGR